MKKSFLFLIGAVVATALALMAAPNYTGPNAVPDNFGNVAVGQPSWFPASTCTSNTVYGVGAGGSITNGTNNIYIANAGANENNTIRIGTSGTQTTAVIAGVVTATNGFASYNTYSNSLTGSIGWTNTNAFNVYLVFTNGVTNVCLSNLTSVLFRNVSSTVSTPISLIIPPGFIETNTSAGSVMYGL